MNKIVLIAMMLCLSSCSAGSTKEYVPVSIPVTNYPSAMQAQASNELKACGDKCKITKEMMKDGHTLRKEVKDMDKASQNDKVN